MSWASVAMGPPVYATWSPEVRDPFEQPRRWAPRVALAGGEQRRRGGHPGAHAGPEVRGDAGFHRLRAAVGVEARDVEPEPLRTFPEVRVLEPPLVGEQRVVHGPEGALDGGGLGRGGRRPRARMARAHREVAEGDAQREPAQARLERGAERAFEVRVDDDERRVLGPPDVVCGPEGRQRCRAEAAQTVAASSASKIRFAPGSSPGEVAS